ncbi:MAG: hypothetical protein WCK03_03240 [Candidatus Taylorbacteria bacterium]
METLKEMLLPFWELAKEMFDAFIEVFPTIVFFILWLLCAIIILPCLFVTNTLFPKWAEWGETF